MCRVYGRRDKELSDGEAAMASEELSPARRELAARLRELAQTAGVTLTALASADGRARSYASNVARGAWPGDLSFWEMADQLLPGSGLLSEWQEIERAEAAAKRSARLAQRGMDGSGAGSARLDRGEAAPDAPGDVTASADGHGQCCSQDQGCVRIAACATEWADAVRRRCAIRASGLAALVTVIGADADDLARLARAVRPRAPLRPDPRTVAVMADAVRASQRLGDTAGPPVVLDTMAQQLVLLRRLIQGASEGAVRRDLWSLYGRLLLSASYCARDVGGDSVAKGLIVASQQAATQAGDGALSAYAFDNLASLAASLHDVRAMLDATTAAQSLMPRDTRGDAHLSACLLSTSATAYARAHDPKRSQAALDAARDAIDSAPADGEPTSPAYWHGLGVVLARESVCLALLGRFQAAVESARAGLARIGPELPGSRAWGEIRLGNALLETWDLDEAVAAYQRAASITTTHTSDRLFLSLRDTLVKLQPYERRADVRELRELIHTAI